MKSANADQFAIVLDTENFLSLDQATDPMMRRVFRIRIGNASRHARDIPVTSQYRDARGVAVRQRAGGVGGLFA